MRRDILDRVVADVVVVVVTPVQQQQQQQAHKGYWGSYFVRVNVCRDECNRITRL